MMLCGSRVTAVISLLLQNKTVCRYLATATDGSFVLSKHISRYLLVYGSYVEL